MEIWKDVEGFEGIYKVSNFGNVKRLDRIVKMYNGGQFIKKEGLLKQTLHNDYFEVCLVGINKKRKSFKVHRLVAKAFLCNENNLYIINHKNEIKTDNRVENLEWCDSKYNCNFGTRNERISSTMINSSKISKIVYQYDLNMKLVGVYPSTKELDRLGIACSKKVSACCLGKRKTHKGYIWKYEEVV